ncbi:MAG TPA: uracil-DNA glycosylase [Planctomycetota bacterium]|nr:uracil-DNA glycosylase [Planctomycetota bacterium]
MGEVTALLHKLESFRPTELLANPFRHEDSPHDLKEGAAIRRRNVEIYLNTQLELRPQLILLGEAAGYQGCRFSGMAFTSEHTLQTNPFFAGKGCARSGTRERLWREPSGTIVWETIGLIQRPALLWNILPFHPHRKGEPLSNRTPTPKERHSGLEYFLEVRKLFPEAAIIAVGRISAEVLTANGIKHECVRHPSNGGKREFQAGVLEIVKRIPKYNPPVLNRRGAVSAPSAVGETRRSQT